MPSFATRAKSINMTGHPALTPAPQSRSRYRTVFKKVEEGALVVDNGLVQALGVTQKELLAVVAEQRIEVEQRVRRFRGDRPRIPFNGQHVVIVDDGLATGATATAACQVARAQGAFKITVAVPVSSSVSAEKLARVADDVVCLEQPDPFYAVGQSYADFVQTSDKEVVELLRERADEYEKPGAQRNIASPVSDGLECDSPDDPPSGSTGSS